MTADREEQDIIPVEETDAGEAGAGPEEEAAGPKGWGRAVRVMVIQVLLTLAVAGLIHETVFATYWIPSESMAHTLEIGDRIGVESVSRWWDSYERGDVVVFRLDGQEMAWVKRVVAVGGETVMGFDGQVYVDGEALSEPYLGAEVATAEEFGPVVVPDGHLFVMGDNRSHSLDSRVVGPIAERTVLGKALFILWPVNHISGL